MIMNLSGLIKMNSIFLMLMLASCATNQNQRIQDEAICLTNPPHKCFKQLPENHFHPPEFFTCDQTTNWR